MKNVFKTSLVALSLMMGFQAIAAEPTYWNSEEGIKRLATAEHKNDFYTLANFYEAQNNKMFCGVASTTIVLNALRIPTDKQAIPHDTSLVGPHEKAYFPSKEWSVYIHRYTQNTVLTHSPKPRIEVMGKPHEVGGERDYGFKLPQFKALVESNNANIETYPVKDASQIDSIRNEMIKGLDTKDAYVVANYYRPILDQFGAGHFSPVAAYDQASDSFLVLDVNSANYPWAWVETKNLVKSMNTKDGAVYRGFAIITDKA